MADRRSDVIKESRKKGLLAGATGAATVTLGVAVGWPLALIGAVPTAIFGYQWWKHRLENGIRF